MTIRQHSILYIPDLTTIIIWLNENVMGITE